MRGAAAQGADLYIGVANFRRGQADFAEDALHSDPGAWVAAEVADAAENVAGGAIVDAAADAIADNEFGRTMN